MIRREKDTAPQSLQLASAVRGVAQSLPGDRDERQMTAKSADICFFFSLRSDIQEILSFTNKRRNIYTSLMDQRLESIVSIQSTVKLSKFFWRKTIWGSYWSSAVINWTTFGSDIKKQLKAPLWAFFSSFLLGEGRSSLHFSHRDQTVNPRMVNTNSR